MEQNKRYDNVHGLCGHRAGTKSLNLGARVAPGQPEKLILGRQRSHRARGVCVFPSRAFQVGRHPTQAAGVKQQARAWAQ